MEKDERQIEEQGWKETLLVPVEETECWVISIKLLGESEDIVKVEKRKWVDPKREWDWQVVGIGPTEKSRKCPTRKIRRTRRNKKKEIWTKGTKKRRRPKWNCWRSSFREKKK